MNRTNAAGIEAAMMRMLLKMMITHDDDGDQAAFKSGTLARLVTSALVP